MGLVYLRDTRLFSLLRRTGFYYLDEYKDYVDIFSYAKAHSSGVNWLSRVLRYYLVFLFVLVLLVGPWDPIILAGISLVWLFHLIPPFSWILGVLYEKFIVIAYIIPYLHVLGVFYIVLYYIHNEIFDYLFSPSSYDDIVFKVPGWAKYVWITNFILFFVYAYWFMGFIDEFAAHLLPSGSIYYVIVISFIALSYFALCSGTIDSFSMTFWYNSLLRKDRLFSPKDVRKNIRNLFIGFVNIPWVYITPMAMFINFGIVILLILPFIFLFAVIPMLILREKVNRLLNNVLSNPYMIVGYLVLYNTCHIGDFVDILEGSIRVLGDEYEDYKREFRELLKIAKEHPKLKKDELDLISKPINRLSWITFERLRREGFKGFFSISYVTRSILKYCEVKSVEVLGFLKTEELDVVFYPSRLLYKMNNIEKVIIEELTS